MKNTIIKFTFLALVIIAFSNCYKKVDIPITNNATVTLNSGTNYVTQDITVNPKDSLVFSYTITSNSTQGIKFVGLQKNATDISSFVALTKDTLTGNNITNYTATKRFIADSAAGTYTYRITALDSSGLYIGSKSVSVTVTPDFNYYTLRTIQFPDSATKANKCYFSINNNGTSYAYADGAANSANIDFGYYYDTTKILVGTAPNQVLTERGSTIYALNNTIAPFNAYDITTWTKNATLLKLSTSVTFASLTSGGALRTAGLAAFAAGGNTRVSYTDRASGSLQLTGAVILFKTVAGKYGALTVNYSSFNHVAGSYYTDGFASIDVKIQK